MIKELNFLYNKNFELIRTYIPENNYLSNGDRGLALFNNDITELVLKEKKAYKIQVIFGMPDLNQTIINKNFYFINEDSGISTKEESLSIPSDSLENILKEMILNFKIGEKI